MSTLLIVGVGGFFGAIARYLLGGWINDLTRSAFPLGTFVINISGAFILGFFMTLTTERFALNPNLRPLIAIGFLGAYTTFSTFSYETVRLIEDGSFGLALANAGVSLLVGVVAIYAGIFAGRSI